MTEPGAGSDVRSTTTMARRAGGDWVINGTQHFISHADTAGFVVLFAVTGTGKRQRCALSAADSERLATMLTVRLSRADCPVPAWLSLVAPAS
jgi:alkylation response protein AidB-like acyl-CoA dehydrogenase